MDHSPVTNQLSRIEGQVRGIQKMLTDERSCLEVLQQIIAVRASLSTIGIKLLKADLRACAKHPDPATLDQLMTHFFKLT